MSNEKALSYVKEVKVGDEIIKVQKLPLGEYVKFIQVLKNLPNSIISDLQKVDTEDETASMNVIFDLFVNSWDQVIELISLGTGVDKDTIENDPSIGLDGGVELFYAVYEVNNLSTVFETVKKIFSRSKG